MSVYLEVPLAASVRKQAKAEETSISDVVRQALKQSDDEVRFTKDEFIAALEDSPIGKMRAINEEQYAQFDTMVDQGLTLLHALKVIDRITLGLGDSPFSDYYAAREREVARFVVLFYGLEEEKALEIIRDIVATKMKADAEEVPDMVAEMKAGIGLQPGPTAIAAGVDEEELSRGFSLRSLFTKRNG